MTWISTKTIVSGWFWYREPGKNFNKPMPAWVFNPNGDKLYVTLMAVHDDRQIDPPVHFDTLKGEWAGPMEMPQ